MDSHAPLHPLLQPIFEHRDVLQGHAYFLLDAAASRSLPGELFKQVAEDYYVSLFEGSGNDNEDIVDQAPYLVELTEPYGFARYLARKADLRSWGFFLVRRHPLRIVAEHFKQYLAALLPDGEQVYFRFYDPRVLVTLLDASTVDEINVFLGPAEAVYAARTPQPGVLAQFILHEQLPHPIADDPPWVMSERQDQALRIQALGEVPHEMAETLRATLPAPTKELSQQDLVKLAHRAIHRAERYQIRSQANVLLFAAGMLVFGPEFDETGDWYRPLAAPHSNEHTKARLLAVALQSALQDPGASADSQPAGDPLRPWTSTPKTLFASLPRYWVRRWTARPRPCAAKSHRVWRHSTTSPTTRSKTSPGNT